MRSLVFAISCGIVTITAAAPHVSNVTIPELPFAKSITIGYDLEGETSIVTFDILTNGVSIGAANIVSVTGDVNGKVEPGTGKSIVWQAYQDWPDHTITNRIVQAKVTAWSLDNPPDVMVVDLTTKSNIAFYATFDSLPGGVGDNIYKTDKLVMRKIPAGGSVFTMGESGGSGARFPHFVAFTNDFYLGVYEVTQKQLENVSGQRGTSSFAENENADILPCDAVAWGNRTAAAWSIRDYRTTSAQGIARFSTKSFLSAFIKFSGIGFDLPTSAQWEFACRAGTSTKFNGGSNDVASMDDLGWYSGNSDSAPHPVGAKNPNDFGLYDMHGNVMEWVLDGQYSPTENPYNSYEINPARLPSESAVAYKERRGGGYAQGADECSSAYRLTAHVFTSSAGGFRLWAPAKMW